MEEQRETWDEYFLGIAVAVSKRSKDPSTKTGCVIVKDKFILSTGYNGFPKGVKDTPERWNDRETKYKFVSHCDRNAIYAAANHGVCLKGSTMYLTGPACHECAKAIVQAGIVAVAWPAVNDFPSDRWAESISIMRAILEEAGVEIREV